MTHQRIKGFSLVEMLIYVAIAAVIMIAVVDTVLGIVNVYSELRLVRNNENSAMIAMDRMSREIRNATSIDGQSVLGSTLGRLVLASTVNGNPSTADFYINDGILYFKKDGVYVGPLTSSTTDITSLVFTSLSTTTSKAVKIDMSLSSSYETKVKTGTFHTTIILRGSY